MGQSEVRVEALEDTNYHVQFASFIDKSESPQQWFRNFETCVEYNGYDMARNIKAFKMQMRNATALRTRTASGSWWSSNWRIEIGPN